MDAAMSLCRTEYLWCLHSDCFVINRNLLAELLEQADGGKQPVIGYESVSANKHAECKGMVSHTCTLLHMPTMDRLDVSWSMRRLKTRYAVGATDVISDVEMALNYRLREGGIVPLILGAETQGEVERDANRVHLRSATLGADLLAAQPGARTGKETVLEELREIEIRGRMQMQVSHALSFRRSSPRVSIIVTARNYGRFLAECLSSCLTQSEQSVEVIYSDDASTDDSVKVARSIPDVRTIAHPIHTGVVASRNRGVSTSRGDVLIHVDGDDRLPHDFVAKHLEALTDSTPFVYGPAQAFGLHDTLWKVEPWGNLPLWEMNFVNTSAAIWRRAFDAAGGWRETSGRTMWDWHLFLRASRYGTPAPSEAVLQYRQHNESWSHSHDVERTARRVELLGNIRRELVRVSVGCVYSGRVPELLPRWLDAICQNLAVAGVVPELVILDNSKDQADALYRETGNRSPSFSSVRITPNPWPWSWKSEIERRNLVATFMAASSNRILTETTGELVWLVEDDVIVPHGGFNELFHAITDGHPLKGAVAGAYQNRHTKANWVSGYWRDDKPVEIPALDEGQMSVDLTGTGCLLFWRDLVPPRFEPFLNGIPAHDWAFAQGIKGNRRDVVLVPSVRCKHYVTKDEWV
jgi:glycosyltransferase involved in cell wall biosynthesis